MSPNEREWGSIIARLDQTIHTQRNFRMMLDSAVEDCQELRGDITRLRIILRTTLTVLGCTVAALAWVAEIVLSRNPLGQMTP